MSRLSWIQDEVLEDIVDEILNRALSAQQNSIQRLEKNVIDPFSSLFLAKASDITNQKNLKRVQGYHTISSAISNAIGYLHQKVIGSIDGFIDYDSGYDIESTNRKIIAEIKNKHNTMNSSNRDKVISDLDIAIKQKQNGWVAYLVIIIPKTPKRYKTQLSKRQVYEVDGTTFYEIATESKTAMRDLFYAVMDILDSRKPLGSSVVKYCENVLKEGIPE
ncbi:MAG: hypothetical protein B0D92_04060 [Spirochaeta sp. LUC14_002_19_P3]|nr:MAG: hypothetical protein B0D92_04060 [Spirochaeta sp. LUC14_002_19_P3]